MAFLLRKFATRGINCSLTSSSESIHKITLVSCSSRSPSSTTRKARTLSLQRPQAFLLVSSPSRPTALTKMDQDNGRNESTSGKNDWKKRPPYSIHDDNFKAIYEASCHCGKVQYGLSRKEPLDSKLCHCTTCQTQHAAPFQWAAIFHKEDINFKEGHHHLEWYDPTEKSVEHKLPCKVRCSFCHSPIMVGPGEKSCC